MINFNLVSNCTISLFSQRIVPLVTDRQKKIIAIVAAALGALALCYILISRCLFKTINVKIYRNGELIKKTYPNGIIEEGKFEGGKLHGPGKKTYPNGTVEEGDFENAQLKKGKVRYADGTVDEGEFHDGHLKDGQVKITLPNGKVIEGLFTEIDRKIRGKKTGPGQTVEEGVFEIVYVDGKRTIQSAFLGESFIKPVFQNMPN